MDLVVAKKLEEILSVEILDRMTLGGHFLAMADALGFGWKFGIHGSYARGGEGTEGNAPNDVAKPVILDGDGVEVNASAQVGFDWDGDGFKESGRRVARNRSASLGLWWAAA